MENVFGFCLCFIDCVGAGKSTLMSNCDGLDPHNSPSKDGREAVYEKRNGREGVFFPPESVFSLCKYYE